jgi:glycogen operon protein
LVQKNADFLRFVQALIAFRRSQPTVRRSAFLTGESTSDGQLQDVSWYGPDGKTIAWEETYHSLTCLFAATGLDDPAARDVLIMMHSGQEPQEFLLPESAHDISWRLFIDTAADTPGDIYPAADGPAPPSDRSVQLDHHTLRCYVSSR